MEIAYIAQQGRSSHYRCSTVQGLAGPCCKEKEVGSGTNSHYYSHVIRRQTVYVLWGTAK